MGEYMASNPIQSLPGHRGSLANLGGLLALAMVACSGADSDDGSGLGAGAGPGGAGTFPSATAGATGAPLGSAGSAGSAPFTTAGAGGSGGVFSGTAGAAGVVNGVGGGGSAGVGTPPGGAPSFGGSSSTGGGSVVPSAGAAGSPIITARDHCVDGYAPDPTDETISDGPVNFVRNGQTDTTVQPAVIEWFTKNVWQEAHFQWHNIRRCRGGMVIRNRAGGLDPCTHTDLVPANQENQGPGDGLEFLAMHRHMIQSLKQLWPKHKEQFEGWDHYPTKAEDVPEAWRADWRNWDQATSSKMAMADDPAKNINMWATEGDFGQWIQSTSGIHGALHFKWVRPQNSEHGLGNQFTNIDNYLFWKMHGWIDKVWDRYREAKGKKPTDPDIIEAVRHQCYHMDDLAVLIKPDLNPNPGAACTTPAPIQTGVFVEKIRPIFESTTAKCTGCHGPAGGEAGLSLGGSECIKSSDVVAAIVNKPSKNGGQFKLIEPGDPDKSWLYLKVTGKTATAACTRTNGVDCNNQLMPPGQTAPILTQAEQDALRDWILAGAPAPQ